MKHYVGLDVSFRGPASSRNVGNRPFPWRMLDFSISPSASFQPSNFLRPANRRLLSPVLRRSRPIAPDSHPLSATDDVLSLAFVL